MIQSKFTKLSRELMPKMYAVGFMYVLGLKMEKSTINAVWLHKYHKAMDNEC